MSLIGSKLKPSTDSTVDPVEYFNIIYIVPYNHQQLEDAFQVLV